MEKHEHTQSQEEAKKAEERKEKNKH